MLFFDSFYSYQIFVEFCEGWFLMSRYFRCQQQPYVLVSVESNVNRVYIYIQGFQAVHFLKLSYLIMGYLQSCLEISNIWFTTLSVTKKELIWCAWKSVIFIKYVLLWVAYSRQSLVNYKIKNKNIWNITFVNDFKREFYLYIILSKNLNAAATCCCSNM